MLLIITLHWTTPNSYTILVVYLYKNYLKKVVIFSV